MNKITTILLVSTLCSIFLVACAQQSVNAPITATPVTPTPVPTEIPTATPTEITVDEPFKEDDFLVLMQLDFDSLNDFKYLNFHLSGGSIEPDKTSINKNEMTSFAEFSETSVNLRSFVRYDTALHIRWKVNDENTCHRFGLAPFISQSESLTAAYIIGVSGCSFEALQTSLDSIGSNDPVTYDAPFESQGMLLDDGQWLDAVFWVQEGTATPSLNLYAWQTENPNIYYAEKRLLNGLEEANMFSPSFDVFFGSIAVDSVQMVSENIESYLWFNAPAFSNNYEDIVTLFNTDFNDQ